VLKRKRKKMLPTTIDWPTTALAAHEQNKNAV